MRFEPRPLREALTPLVAVHGVELVALEWLQGPGRGVLRAYIDRPHGDPRTAAEQRDAGMTADICAAVSRDLSAQLDLLDPFDVPYDLEVSSPGFERPVQKREDFERFVGLVVKFKTRVPIGGRGSFEGFIVGTVDRPDGGFAVRVTVDGQEQVFDVRDIPRAKLAEIKPPKPVKPGKAPRPHRRLDEAAGTATTTTTAEGPSGDPRGER